MGATGWSYFVPYQSDISAAFRALTVSKSEGQKRFNALMQRMPVDPNAMDPELLAEIMSCGEDPDAMLAMMHIGARRETMSVGPLSLEETIELFGTDRPTHDMVANCRALRDRIGRGEGVYVVVYKDERASEIFFAGYTID